MNKQATLLITLILASVPAYAESLENQIDSIRTVHSLPALGVYGFSDSHVDGYSVTGVRKFGNSTLATVTDKFHFGSNGKAMTATLAALLIEDGLLQWTSTLGDLLPNVSALHPRYRSVTFEMLLAHRSGSTGDLMDFENGQLWSDLWQPTLVPRDGRMLVIERVLSVEPAYEPGSEFVYSNAGYMIAARILEQLTGQTYEQLLTQRLWDRLAMTSCGFGAPGDPNALDPDQPWPHTETENGPQPIAPGFHADNPPSTHPAGGMHCSMADWAKFLKLHSDGFNGQPTPVLHAASFTKLHTPYPGDEYTYGAWLRYDHREWAQGPVLAHEGDNTLNHALVVVAPALGAGFISVTNVGGVDYKIAEPLVSKRAKAKKSKSPQANAAGGKNLDKASIWFQDVAVSVLDSKIDINTAGGRERLEWMHVSQEKVILVVDTFADRKIIHAQIDQIFDLKSVGQVFVERKKSRGDVTWLIKNLALYYYSCEQKFREPELRIKLKELGLHDGVRISPSQLKRRISTFVADAEQSPSLFFRSFR